MLTRTRKQKQSYQTKYESQLSYFYENEKWNIVNFSEFLGSNGLSLGEIEDTSMYRNLLNSISNDQTQPQSMRVKARDNNTDDCINVSI
ncbi:hypothetical protein RCL_jg17700.t1 [Rhizophagus clarus]|uniref:Uncharacterized protein n=1 Tax=Rhizophagus clarus TaxID=94130 RepID=A0A8H3QH91_9GLOM|nr:hypothetical protein RCL_jg17700.t1 [Rhizophagus clarus]